MEDVLYSSKIASTNYLGFVQFLDEALRKLLSKDEFKNCTKSRLCLQGYDALPEQHVV